jgi:hypothetical protein
MPGVVVVLVFSKKKGELWQHKKKHKNGHQFECRVIRVVGIDPFNSAHALLHILGR